VTKRHLRISNPAVFLLLGLRFSLSAGALLLIVFYQQRITFPDWDYLSPSLGWLVTIGVLASFLCSNLYFVFL